VDLLPVLAVFSVIKLNHKLNKKYRVCYPGTAVARTECYSYPNATEKAGTEAGEAEGVKEGEDDRRKEVVQIKRQQPRVREIEEITKLSDKPRS